MEDQHEIDMKDYTEIDIIGDGNCFYRCLAMFFESTQENHKYCRETIYMYIYNNKDIFKSFFDINNND